MMAAQTVEVCRCDHCRRNVAEVKDGKLIITSRHDGEWHTTEIDLADLTRERKPAT